MMNTESRDSDPSLASPPQDAERREGAPVSDAGPQATFWARMKDHKVAQWMLTYGAAAYTLLHIVEMVSEALDWPHVVMRLVTVTLLAGIPAVAAVAYYHGHRAKQRISGRELAGATVLLVLVGVAVWALGTQRHQSRAGSALSGTPALNRAPPNKSIAVLPFVDMSEKKDQEYFSDGLSEELIDLLSRVPDLRVPARTSSFYFKNKPAEVSAIARALNVANVLEGSVRKSGNKVRITAQLIRADNGYHVWSQTYDRDLNDIFQLQDEIASSVVQSLKATLHADVPHSGRGTQNINAYTLLLQGRYLNNRQTAADNVSAISVLERAVSLDPDYAAAWAELSQAYFFGTYDASAQSANLGEKASHAAERAVALDVNSAAAHDALGTVKMYRFDWDGAAADYEAAARAEPVFPHPNWVPLHQGCIKGPCFGRLVASLSRQIDQDPLNASALFYRSNAFYVAREFELSERDVRRALDLSPALTNAHAYLSDISRERGDMPGSFREAQEEPSGPARRLALARVNAAAGHREDADRALREVLASDSACCPYQIAAVYALRGNTDAAFKWLDQAFERRDNTLAWVKVDPVLDSLRSDPRFAGLLKRVKLD
jgi:TolB-like protein